MTLAHYFTLSRMIISPFFPIIYIEYQWLGIPFSSVPFILICLLAICESTDLIDGIIARRCNQVTDLGKILDPMADSITKISLFFTLTRDPVGLPIYVVLIFLYRDFIISSLRTLCALRGVALGARTSGKLKTVIQAGVLFLILIMLIFYVNGIMPRALMHQISTFAVSGAALYAVASAADYLYSNRLYVKKALNLIS